MTGPLRVRMGLHTCEAEFRDGDYYGSDGEPCSPVDGGRAW